MKLLNVGCGGQRPQDKRWSNLDNLRARLRVGTPERTNLDQEENYFECDLKREPMPFNEDEFDGVALIHVIEHFSCHDAVNVLLECRRVLKPGGILIVSVPDAEYFLSVYDQDTKDRAIELFGEPIHDEWRNTFFDYALFRHDHEQILTRPAMKCLMLKARFTVIRDFSVSYAMTDERMAELFKVLNRRKFSLEMVAIK